MWKITLMQEATDLYHPILHVFFGSLSTVSERGAPTQYMNRVHKTSRTPIEDGGRSICEHSTQDNQRTYWVGAGQHVNRVQKTTHAPIGWGSGGEPFMGEGPLARGIRDPLQHPCHENLFSASCHHQPTACENQQQHS